MATPLIPSEAAVQQGAGAVLGILWLLLLAAWLASRLLAGERSVRAGWTMLALLLFLALHSLSGLVAMQTGNARYALNALWQWLTFGVLFFLARQTLAAPVAARATVAVMLALAVSLSSMGLQQYFIELPGNRAAFERDPEGTIEQTGIDAPPGSPARRQLVDRIYSLEPMGTFALTNSLAGFLAPLLVLTTGVGLANRERLRQDSRFLAGCLASVLLVATCLLLTKSRAALLATLGGAVLVVLGAGPQRRSLRQGRLALLIGGLIVLLALVAGVIAVGGLDLQVLSEAPKSVLYRLEYWQATAHLIARYPWFGCGPGNFQSAYSRFKLPQASETISDPHNFLLEIWATAGTPAVLAFLALGTVYLLQLRAARPGDDPTPDSRSPREKSPGEKSATRTEDPVGPNNGGGVRWWVYAGAFAGVLLAYPCGMLVGFPVHVLVLPLTVVVGGATIWLFDGWTRAGRLPVAPLLAALATLVINLLAAGGISFPGVAGNLWLLAAISLSLSPGDRPRKLSAVTSLALAVGAAALLAANFLTVYSPVLESQASLVRGRSLSVQGRPDAAVAAYQEAARQDPYDPTPWMHLAQLFHQMYLRDGGPAAWDRFEQAVSEARARDPRSPSLMTRVGNWYLEAHRESGDPRHAEAAQQAFQRAAELAPQGAIEHAQWAWASFLAGDEQTAAAQAEKALRLDASHPHEERKLANRVFPWDRTGGNRENSISVEQRMRQLRTEAEERR